jgi:hypothetical protein
MWIRSSRYEKPPEVCSDGYSAFCPLRGEPEGTCMDSIVVISFDSLIAFRPSSTCLPLPCTKARPAIVVCADSKQHPRYSNRLSGEPSARYS